MSEAQLQIPTLLELLEKSAATSEFKEEARNFEKHLTPSERITFARGNPPVKVLRAIMGLLDFHPDAEIDSVEVDGQSGCSDYRGKVLINGGEKSYRFVWDCAWKAEQLGWKDYFGSPDQIKAARTYGYQCFEKFEEA